MWSSSQPFSCLISVQRHPGSEVHLGTDWLKLHILKGNHPSSVASVVIDPFSLGVEGKHPYCLVCCFMAHKLQAVWVDAHHLLKPLAMCFLSHQQIPHLILVSYLAQSVIQILCILSYLAQTVHCALSVHGIPCDGLSYNLCCQALCHHLLNSLCTRQQGSLCAAVAGSCSAYVLVNTISKTFLTPS